MAHPLITTSTSKREERFASPPSAALRLNAAEQMVPLDRMPETILAAVGAALGAGRQAEA